MKSFVCIIRLRGYEYHTQEDLAAMAVLRQGERAGRTRAEVRVLVIRRCFVNSLEFHRAMAHSSSTLTYPLLPVDVRSFLRMPEADRS